MPSRPKPISKPEPADRVTITNDRHEIDGFVRRTTEHAEDFGYAPASVFAVRLALEEAISNAFRHGHKGLPSHTPVTIEFRLTPEELAFRIIDAGPGFSPEAVPDPRLDENLEKPSGRGLMLMRAYMTEVRYAGRGNELILVYRKP
jgi:serine/threonine-protein kinase RsbW